MDILKVRNNRTGKEETLTGTITYLDGDYDYSTSPAVMRYEKAFIEMTTNERGCVNLKPEIDGYTIIGLVYQNETLIS